MPRRNLPRPAVSLPGASRVGHFAVVQLLLGRGEAVGLALDSSSGAKFLSTRGRRSHGSAGPDITPSRKPAHATGEVSLPLGRDAGMLNTRPLLSFQPPANSAACVLIWGGAKQRVRLNFVPGRTIKETRDHIRVGFSAAGSRRARRGTS